MKKLKTLITSTCFAILIGGLADAAKEEDTKPPRRAFETRWQIWGKYRRRLPDERYNKLVKRLAEGNPYVAGFTQAFPESYQISPYGMLTGPGPKICENGNPLDKFVFVAPLYGRYTLRMFVPFCLTKDLTEVEFYEEPYFDMWEVISIRPTGRKGQVRIHSEPVLNEDGGHIVMRAEEWKRLKDAEFDWAALGIKTTKDRPIEGFQETLPEGIAPNKELKATDESAP